MARTLFSAVLQAVQLSAGVVINSNEFVTISQAPVSVSGTCSASGVWMIGGFNVSTLSCVISRYPPAYPLPYPTAGLFSLSKDDDAQHATAAFDEYKNDGSVSVSDDTWTLTVRHELDLNAVNSTVMATKDTVFESARNDSKMVATNDVFMTFHDIDDEQGSENDVDFDDETSQDFSLTNTTLSKTKTVRDTVIDDAMGTERSAGRIIVPLRSTASPYISVRETNVTVKAVDPNKADTAAGRANEFLNSAALVNRLTLRKCCTKIHKLFGNSTEESSETLDEAMAGLRRLKRRLLDLERLNETGYQVTGSGDSPSIDFIRLMDQDPKVKMVGREPRGYIIYDDDDCPRMAEVICE